MFSSIRSVTTSQLAVLEYVAAQRGTGVSVKEWVRGTASPNGPHSCLFLPYSASQIAALRSLIGAWLRLAIYECMNGAERDQRLWIVIDELDALGPIDGLKDALARLRKFGGRCVLGFQSVAQVSSTYGGGEAQTIVENCGNTLILRCSASEAGGTAQFASRLIGEREIIRTQITKSRRPGEFQPSTSRSEHHLTEPAVLPSEIEQLPDLAGYLKLASLPHWRSVQLRQITAPPR
jgi:type IV secretory pathway TraG/TraD family ATPase VirD4